MPPGLREGAPLRARLRDGGRGPGAARPPAEAPGARGGLAPGKGPSRSVLGSSAQTPSRALPPRRRLRDALPRPRRPGRERAGAARAGPPPEPRDPAPARPRARPLRMCIPASSSRSSRPASALRGNHPGPRGRAARELRVSGARAQGRGGPRRSGCGGPGGGEEPRAARRAPGRLRRPELKGRRAGAARSRAAGRRGTPAPGLAGSAGVQPALNGRRPRVAAGGRCACVTLAPGPRGGRGAGAARACAGGCGRAGAPGGGGCE